MTRRFSITLAMLMTLSFILAGCAKAEETVDLSNVSETNTAVAEDKTEEIAETVSDSVQKVEVDEGLLLVDVTIPASWFEDQEKTNDEIIADSEEKGFKECKINEDGSVTYTMTKKRHKEFLKELRESAAESFAEVVDGPEAVESFKAITFNDDMTEFEIRVDSEKYTGWDGLYYLACFIYGSYYQMFEGVDSEDIDVVVNIVDDATNEILSSPRMSEMGDSE